MDKKELKVITLGDSGVGKTSIINTIKERDNNFSKSDKKGNYIIKRKYEKKNIIISLNLIDSDCNQNNEKNIPKQYIRDSHIVLLVFCDIKTLNHLKNNLYTYYIDNVDNENSRFILIGNKSDTFGDDKKEIEKQGNKFAEEIDAQFLMCSTNSEDNKDNLDRYITTEAKRYIDNEEKNKNDDNIQKSENITIGTHDNQNNRRRFRCVKC